MVLSKKQVEEGYVKVKKEYDQRMQKAFTRNQEKDIVDAKLDEDLKKFAWEVDAEKIEQSRGLVKSALNMNEAIFVNETPQRLQQYLIAVSKYGTYISGEINKRKMKLGKCTYYYQCELRKQKLNQNLSSKAESGKEDELLARQTPLQLLYDDKIIAQAKFDNLHKLDTRLEELNFVLQRILKRIEINESNRNGGSGPGF